MYMIVYTVAMNVHIHTLKKGLSNLKNLPCKNTNIHSTGVGTGGRRGLAPPLNFTIGVALALAYATTRTRVTMNAVKVVPTIMQRQLESFFSATKENAAK